MSVAPGDPQVNLSTSGRSGGAMHLRTAIGTILVMSLLVLGVATYSLVGGDRALAKCSADPPSSVELPPASSIEAEWSLRHFGFVCRQLTAGGETVRTSVVGVWP